MQSETFLYRPLERCLLCEKDHLVNVVPLQPIPIATPNFAMPADPELARKALEGVPLDIFQCADCGHLQVGHVGNPDLQYRDYVYTTSLSLGLPEHFKTYAGQVVDTYRPPAGSLVVEIGSNDGTLLRAFKERGYRVLGVDPARAIAEAATAAGIETIGDFFTEATGRDVAERLGKATLIIANNMIANVPDLQDYMRGIGHLLADDGVFVFETQYGADVIERNLLDTVYHEHISYFLVKPTVEFLARYGLQTIGVDRIATKGGSIRVSAQRKGGARPVAAEVARLIDEEQRKNAFAPSYFTTLSSDLRDITREIRARVDAVLAAGKTAGGYGVSVGTTALLPQFGLIGRLSFLVDDDPKKPRVLEGPGYRIPVIGPDELLLQNAGTVVIFAWRYADSILRKHQRFLAAGGEFIIPLPHVEIVRDRSS
jgi:SAM-dependent methyltransferase